MSRKVYVNINDKSVQNSIMKNASKSYGSYQFTTNFENSNAAIISPEILSNPLFRSFVTNYKGRKAEIINPQNILCLYSDIDKIRHEFASNFLNDIFSKTSMQSYSTGSRAPEEIAYYFLLRIGDHMLESR